MNKETNRTATGIIAEYNPFHNGHAYHIARAKELSGADYCVVVMSGDFVQRGAPALYSKHIRTAMALSSGADLVLEMPAVFATSSAEDFAACGVALLDRLGIISHLCFGSECGDIAMLSDMSAVLAREPASYTRILKEQLKSGRSYPQAREYACYACLSQHGALNTHHLGEVLRSPNNILGIEYCKALLKRNSSMIPITLKRSGSGYHDLELSTGHGRDCSSASAIRQSLLLDADLSKIGSQIPEAVYSILADSKPLFTEDFTALLNTTLLRLFREGIPFHTYADVSEELEGRLLSMLLEFTSFEERIRKLKTRQYTYTRISRALLHLMLGIRKEDVSLGYSLDYAPYARVLGFKRDSAALLTQIKNQSQIPLITKTADAGQVLPADAHQMLMQDFHCSHIYNALWNSRHHQEVPNEFSRQIVIL